MKTFKSFKNCFGHTKFLIAVIVVLASIFVETGTSHASSYTTLANFYGESISACTTYINAYGGIWQTTVLFNKLASTPNHYYTVVDSRIVLQNPGHGGSAGYFENVSSQGGNAYFYNVVGAETVDSSAALSDYLQLVIYSSTKNTGAYQDHILSDFSKIARC